MKIARFAIALALAAAPLAAQAPSLGLALYRHGHTATVAPGDLYFDPSCIHCDIAHGTFNPSSAIICAGPCDGGRYGWDKHTKGHMVGPEGTSPDEVQQAVDMGCYPFGGLGLPAGYRVTDLDYRDALDVALGSSSVYSAVAQCVRRPVPQPTAEPTPPPAPTPVATPPCLNPSCLPQPTPAPAVAPPQPTPRPSPSSTPACAPCPACGTCPAYDEIPAWVVTTYLAAPYWRHPLTVARQGLLDKANRWAREHKAEGGWRWYVPGVRTSGQIGQAVTP